MADLNNEQPGAGEMLFTRAAYIGVDPTRGKYAVAYAALDADLKLLALNSGSVEESLAFLGGQKQAVAAVNAPQKLSRPGLIKILPDDPGAGQDCRQSEAKLLQEGFSTYETPSENNRCKPWMRSGFEIYQHLENVGFKSKTEAEYSLRVIEAQAGLSYHRWIGRDPMHKYSLEGRIQRQIVLRDLGLPVQEPMNFFEEITRYRLLQGELPEDVLHSSDELDALALAYTAWMLDSKDARLDREGDDEEGWITMPADSLAAYQGRY